MVANNTAPSERSNSSIGTTNPPKRTKDSGKPDPVFQAGIATTPDLAIGSKFSEEPIRHRLPTNRGEGRSVCGKSNAPRDVHRQSKNAGRTTSPNNRTAGRSINKLGPINPNSIADALPHNISE